MAKITDENRLVVTLTLADFKDALHDVLLDNNFLKEPQKELQETPKLVTRFQVAIDNNVCPETIDNWVKNKIFPKPVKIGGRKYFYKSDLDLFYDAKKKNINS